MPIYLKQFTKFANAGDVASSYILSRLLSDDVETVGQAALDHANLIAIGSILHWADAHSVIWGSGLISAEIKLQMPPARLVAVRGHLTRRRLQAMGIAAPDLVGDPGILMSDFYSPPRRAPTAVGIIPHYVDAAHPFVTQARPARSCRPPSTSGCRSDRCRSTNNRTCSLRHFSFPYPQP